MRWVRSQRATAIDVGQDLVLIGRDGVVRRLAGDSAELAREVLGFVALPRTREEVIDHIEEIAGPLGERRGVVEQLLDVLAEAAVIAEAREAPTSTAGRATGAGANIVVCVSGAIAATHTPALVSALQRRGHVVEVALTETATRFVSVDALTAILQRAVHTSLWPAAAHAPVPHVALAQWADLVVVYPASGTTIGRIAAGDFSDLVAAIALTTRAPVVIVPSMNDAMLDAPAVQRNLERLREDGHAIVHGVPSAEVADAPATRTPLAGAAPSPAEVVSAIEALRSAGVLQRRGASTVAARDWDAAYRRPLVPWAREDCDPDIAAALATHAPAPRRVLDIGCGLGQVARHATAAGHRVVATDISEVALFTARSHASRAASDAIVWLRDDICATALVGTFDVIVDRATLHALPRHRATAYAASIRKLLAPNGIAILKTHRDGVPGTTTGYTSAALTALLGLELVTEAAAELPNPADGTPIPSVLTVLRAP